MGSVESTSRDRFEVPSPPTPPSVSMLRQTMSARSTCGNPLGSLRFANIEIRGAGGGAPPPQHSLHVKSFVHFAFHKNVHSASTSTTNGQTKYLHSPAHTTSLSTPSKKTSSSMNPTTRHNHFLNKKYANGLRMCPIVSAHLFSTPLRHRAFTKKTTPEHSHTPLRSRALQGNYPQQHSPKTDTTRSPYYLFLLSSQHCRPQCHSKPNARPRRARDQVKPCSARQSQVAAGRAREDQAGPGRARQSQAGPGKARQDPGRV